MMKMRSGWLRGLGPVTGMVLAACAGTTDEGLLALTPHFDDIDGQRPQRPVELIPVVGGVGQPTDVAAVPGHPDRLVALSKWGGLHLVDLEQGTREDWLWLDVAKDLELGLLGIAFDPAFEHSGRFWLHRASVRSAGDYVSVISEFAVDPASLVDPHVVADVLTIDQPTGIHAGGQIAFGPDKMLYVAVGDGGPDAPADGAQDLGTLQGAILRIDVSAPGAYVVPDDNPFVSVAGARPEIWAYGLRNPWRFTFAAPGELLVADVGEHHWEEVDLVRAGDNLGWNDREGYACSEGSPRCTKVGRVDPIFAYGHDEGISITGGVVATAEGPLQGRYLFGDFGTGRLWALTVPKRPVRTAEVSVLGRFDIMPSAFGRDASGDVWVADFRGESIYRIEVATP